MATLPSITRDANAVGSAHSRRAFERREFNHQLHWYVATDAIALIAGCLFALAFAASVNALFLGRDAFMLLSEYGAGRVTQFLTVAAAVLLWFQHTDHYRVRMPFWCETKKIASTLCFAMMADGFLQFAAKEDVSRLWLVSGWLVAAAGIVSLRAAVRSWLRGKGRFHVSTLLVGNGAVAEEAQAALKAERGLGYDIRAQITDLPTAFSQAGRSWGALCKLYGVEYVVIALEGDELAASEPYIAQLMRESVPFSVSQPLRHVPVQGMVPQYVFSHDTLLLTRANGLQQPIPVFLKRAMDVLAAGSVLLALSPLMLVLAALVKRDGGRAFYGHMRLGRGGKPFPCLKFRSMVMNGDAVLEAYLAENPQAREEWEATRKLQNDPRVTKIGDFLRRSSLDELPQLLNVLKGDMSLVGPRPIVTAEVQHYDSDIAHYYRVRPGITGLWQVSGRSDVSYPQRVKMDSWYVRNWSLWHDIAIICKTFPAVLKRGGAY